MALTRGYVAALAVMAVLIITGATIVDLSLRTLGEDAEVVNVAGRQRMLSQRIAKDALRIGSAASPAELADARADLADAVTQFSHGRRYLLDSAAGEFRRRARALVVENHAVFDSLLSAAAGLADPRASPAALAREVGRVLAAEPAFLARVDSAVTILSTEAAIRVRRTRMLMYVIVSIVLLGLVFVGWYILRPAVLGIRAAVGELRRVNAELDVALEEARGVAKAKSEFLATMSHELRTPLNAVIGLTGLLEDTPLDARQRKYVSTVNHSGEALLGLINNILDLSKIDAGGIELEVLDFDLRELVETAAETLALRAESRGVELATHVAHPVPAVVRGDPGRLRQVLLNLLGNALKFTEHGSVTVRVTPAAGDRVRFEITDTGIGIPADKIGRLFRAFSQVDASTTRRFGGTGLGLDISRRLVELMGGTIGVDSTVGVGSTFHFELPLAASDAHVTGTHRAPDAELRDRRTLIVDDTEANRLLLRETITGWGMRPAEVASAADALSELRAAAAAGQPYELALLDWQMPDMDGYALAAEVRRDPAIAETPLVMLSSFTHQPDPDAAAAARFAATLAKPVRQRPLMEALLAALAGTDGAADTRPATVHSRDAGSRWPGKRVLVADDNPVNVLVLKSMLETHGLRVETAADGNEVSDACERSEYHLIMMDVYMPGVDGLTATRRLREREAAGGHPRIPVVACTASVTQDDRDACTAAGMDDYVSKPIARDVLDATLRRWLGEPKPAADPATAAPSRP